MCSVSCPNVLHSVHEEGGWQFLELSVAPIVNYHSNFSKIYCCYAVKKEHSILVLNYVSNSVVWFMSKNYTWLVGMHNWGQHSSDDSVTGSLVALKSYFLTSDAHPGRHYL